MLRSAYGKGWYCYAVPFKRSIKLCLFLLISFHLQAYMPGESQVVTLLFKDAPLQKVFAEIKKQTGYSFAYSETDLSAARRVNINIANTRIQDALSVLFQDQPLSFTIIEKIVVVRAKSEKKINQEHGSLPPLDAIDVRGRVLNETGDAVAGVSVQVKGTKTGTSTDGEGDFALTKVDPNATLVLSAVNIETMEAGVGGRRNMDIRVKGKTGKLDEVQVIAYGTTSQRFNTGNVTSVKASDIEKQPVQNPLLALQGRVPGLVVTQATGLPGSGVKVRIQGQNSIGNSNLPLYVVDGVPIESKLTLLSSGEQILGGSVNEGFGNPLNYINPQDIESISVLKDADATAIYGSRAANGAILITTKKGRAGKTQLDLNMQQGWGSITRFVEMMNRRQYLDMRYEAFKNDELIPSADPNAQDPYKYAPDLMFWDTTRETNWQKTLIGGTAQYTNVSASISGGTSSLQFLLAGTYNRQNTVFPGKFSDQRASMHVSIGTTSQNKRLKLQFSTIYMYDDNRLPGGDLTNMAVSLAPVAPALYNADGSLNWAIGPDGASTWFKHPLADVLYGKYKNNTTNLVSNMQIGYDLMRNLEFRANIGYTILRTQDFLAFPLEYYAPPDRINQSRYANYGNRSMRSWNIEPQLAYKTEIFNGKLDALVGFTIQQNRNTGVAIDGVGYPSDQVLENIAAAAQLSVGSSMITDYKYNGLFARLNYNWEGKYVLNLTARRDGTSRFGMQNRFNNFASIGGAWIFSQERFLQNNNWLSFGKLRSSYGTTGSDQVGDYSYLSLYNFYSSIGVPYQGTLSLIPGDPNNPYLKWEQTRKLQIGIDLGFLKDRLVVGVTYSRNRSSNQLLSNRLPATTGANSIQINLPALVQNTTLEFTLSSINVKSRKFEWSSNFNLTVARNKLVDFPGLEKSTYANILIIGQPLFSARIYRYAGIDQTSGLYQFYDKNGNVTLNPQPIVDQVFYNNFPRFYGGFQNRISYHAFELDFLCQFVKQNGSAVYINNGQSLVPGVYAMTGSNQPADVANRWQKAGDNALVQKYSTNNSGIIETQLERARVSDLIQADASFMRLKNMSLSWEIPASWKTAAKLQDCRLYLQAQNLFTITNYKGNDPENQSISALPPLRVITFGIKASL
jgi:TonB-linked SusC/RagA family outer membrane protein